MTLHQYLQMLQIFRLVFKFFLNLLGKDLNPFSKHIFHLRQLTLVFKLSQHYQKIAFLIVMLLNISRNLMSSDHSKTILKDFRDALICDIIFNLSSSSSFLILPSILLRLLSKKNGLLILSLCSRLLMSITWENIHLVAYESDADGLVSLGTPAITGTQEESHAGEARAAWNLSIELGNAHF